MRYVKVKLTAKIRCSGDVEIVEHPIIPFPCIKKGNYYYKPTMRWMESDPEEDSKFSESQTTWTELGQEVEELFDISLDSYSLRELTKLEIQDMEPVIEAEG